MNMTKNCRILVIDDNESIHNDIRRILTPIANEFRSVKLGRALLGMQSSAQKERIEKFEIDSCYQGSDALEKVRQAKAGQQPYAFVIVDVRMPPGWDGIETLDRIWQEDPDLQAAICTAYS